MRSLISSSETSISTTGSSASNTCSTVCPLAFSQAMILALALLPSAMAEASSISPSAESRGTLPISLRYIRTGSSMLKLSTRELGSTSSSSSISAISSRGGSVSEVTSGRNASVVISMESFSRESYIMSSFSLSSSMVSNTSESSLLSSLPCCLPLMNKSFSRSLF